MPQVIQIQYVRDLNVRCESDSKNREFVSAASGLVRANDCFYVVADDELHLGIFHATLNEPGFRYRLFEGALDQNPTARKKAKPDLEALVLIPHLETTSQLSLLTVPSGSTSNRVQGSHVLLKTNGQPDTSKQVDFSDLYSALKDMFKDLNIEGAICDKKTLKFFQRGNASSGQNALIELEWAGLQEDIKNQMPLNRSRILKINHHELGSLNGCPLSFTDACVLSNGEVWFLAAAEATSSTYDDGTYMGSVLGKLDTHGEVEVHFRLECPFKAEGLWIHENSNEFFIVTDADNHLQPSKLYKGILPK